jgi:hypothetical protein
VSEAPAPDVIPSELEILAGEPNDEFFCHDLLEWVRARRNCGVNPAPLEDPGVLARLCALPDTRFVEILLQLADPYHTDLEILYQPTVMTRIAALAYATYHARFLRGMKALAGFDVHDYRRELRPYLLRHSAQQGCRQVWAPMSAAALYAQEMAELEFVAEDILPVGATLFVGRAKDGKSLAMWNLLFAVAAGGVVFGKYPTTQGPVLYLALEDGERRTQKRLKDQMRASTMTEPPADFDIPHSIGLSGKPIAL